MVIEYPQNPPSTCTHIKELKIGDVYIHTHTAAESRPEIYMLLATSYKVPPDVDGHDVVCLNTGGIGWERSNTTVRRVVGAFVVKSIG